MAGKAVYWIVQFESKEQYHACSSSPSILKYMRKKEIAEFDNATKSYLWNVRLKKATTPTNLRNIFYEYQAKFIQSVIRTQIPVSRKAEYLRKKENKRVVKEETKKKREDAKLWRLIQQLG